MRDNRYREKMKALREKYNAKVTGRYFVQRKGLNNIISTSSFRFDTIEDAVRYCKDTKALRVGEYETVDAHSVKLNVVYEA